MSGSETSRSTQIYQEAVRHFEAGRLDASADLCGQLLQSGPDDARALYLAGQIAARKGEIARALSLLRKTVDLDPANPLYRFNLGLLYERNDLPEQAFKQYQQAIALRPGYGEAHNNLANVLKQQGRLQEATAHYGEAIRLRPGQAGLYYNLGTAWHGAGNLDQARDCYESALRLDKDHVQSLNNLGNIWKQKGELGRAIDCYTRAIGINDTIPAIHNNLGHALQSTNRLDRAMECYERSFELEPSATGILSNYTQLCLKVCDWPKYRELGVRLDRSTTQCIAAGEGPAEDPFLSILRHDDPKRDLEVGRAWSRNLFQQINPAGAHLSEGRRKKDRERLVVGYCSANFREHASAFLIASLFTLHDRDDFVINCYSFGNDDQSPYRRRIEAGCDSFVDLWQMDTRAAAQRIHDDDVDILVDLNGHSRASRLDVFAWHPAPIQVAFKGFPATTGAGFMDYIIVDDLVCPEEHIPCFSEKPVFLPETYMVADYDLPDTKYGFTRSECRLPENSFVFASFVQPDRIDPVLFEGWMRILRKVDNSVLWLLYSNDLQVENLQKEARAAGVDSKRLVFAEKTSRERHLARLCLADLSLDTRIYNGHTITCDSLWAGVPVVTLKGSHFAARAAASFIAAVGLPELITEGLEEYERLVMELAVNREKRGDIARRLVENSKQEPLFDTKRFLKNFEKALREMWKIYRAGEKPRVIRVME